MTPLLATLVSLHAQVLLAPAIDRAIPIGAVDELLAVMQQMPAPSRQLPLVEILPTQQAVPGPRFLIANWLLVELPLQNVPLRMASSVPPLSVVLLHPLHIVYAALLSRALSLLVPRYVTVE